MSRADRHLARALARGRTAAARDLLRQTLRTTQRAPAVAEACRLLARGGDLQIADAQLVGRGDHLLSLAAGSALALALEELVTVDEHPGRIFRVVWPATLSPLGLLQHYGMDEVR